MSGREKSTRVLFLGTHGQHNIGDELLLETFLHQLGEDSHYVINTYDPGFTDSQLRGRYSFDLIDTSGDRFRLLTQLLKADVVVFGGGSIIKELYATTGRHRYATLLMVLAIVVAARWIGRLPIAMLNIGVGPVATGPGRTLSRLILRQVDLVTVRDPGSYRLCRSLGINGESLRLGTDAVFSMSPDWVLGSARSENPDRRAGPLRIALNLNRDIENPDNWDHFTSRLAEALGRVHAEHELEIHSLPMQAQFKEGDDATMLTQFAARIPEIPFVHHQPITHTNAAAVIAGCDVFVGERLHAIVLASILGVPSLVLAYDVKVRELSTTLGLDEYTVDINTGIEVEAIEDPLRAVISDPMGVGGQARSRAEELATVAQRDFASARRWIEEARV